MFLRFFRYIFLFIVFLCGPSHAREIYVDITAAGDGTGLSWPHAFNHIQNALAEAEPGDTILVAQGLYKPDPGLDRDASFELLSGVSILGGFPTGGAEPHLRDPQLYTTTLSGDLAGDDLGEFQNYSDNSRRIVRAINVQDAVIDGFTITGAFCDDVFLSDQTDAFGGGGILIMHSDVRIKNCRFVDNLVEMTQVPLFAEAGALLAIDSTVHVHRSAFENNRAATAWGAMEDAYGGAVLVEDSDVYISDSTFHDNSTARMVYDQGMGGAIYSTDANLELINCTFSWNHTGWEGPGGAVFAISTNFRATGCDFWFNDAWFSGGAIYAIGSQLDIGQSKFRDNQSAFSGGGIAALQCQLNIDTCEFVENKAGQDWGGGAAVFVYGGQTELSRSLFVANSTTGGGFAYGGSALLADQPEQVNITNCTMFGNYTYDQPEYVLSFLSQDPAVPISISNTIIWDENEHFIGDVIYADHPQGLDVRYSNILGSWPGTGNISTDPLFAKEPQVLVGDGVSAPIELVGTFDLRLRSVQGRWKPDIAAWVTEQLTSPGIDAGDPQTPLENLPWPHGMRVNMGAYGAGAQASMSTNDIGNIADLNYDSTVNFQDYAKAVSHWYGRNSYTIPHGSVTVDGRLDHWQNVQWVQLDQPYYQNAADVVSARFALQWNRSTGKIYAAVVVADTDHVFTDDYQQWDAGDRLEIYSQATAAGGTDFWHWQYPPWHTAQQYVAAPDTAGGYWARWANGDELDDDAQLEYAVEVYEDFIVYEIGVRQFDFYGTRIDQPNVPSVLYPGKTVGFDLVLASRFDQGFGMLSENMMTGKFADAGQFATYVLVDSVDTPACPNLPGDLDRNCALNYRDIAIFAQQWLAE